MELRILDPAKEDLQKGFHLYEKIESGLGEYFLDSLFTEIDSLMLFAGIHQIRFGKYHCKFTQNFPFAKYYTKSESIVLIHAVLDCRQNPESISERFQ